MYPSLSSSSRTSPRTEVGDREQLSCADRGDAEVGVKDRSERLLPVEKPLLGEDCTSADEGDAEVGIKHSGERLLPVEKLLLGEDCTSADEGDAEVGIKHSGERLLPVEKLLLGEDCTCSCEFVAEFEEEATKQEILCASVGLSDADVDSGSVCIRNIIHW